MEGGGLQEEAAGTHLQGVAHQQGQGDAADAAEEGEGGQEAQEGFHGIEELLGGLDAQLIHIICDLRGVEVHGEGSGHQAQQEAHPHKGPVVGFEVGFAGCFECDAIPHTNTSQSSKIRISCLVLYPVFSLPSILCMGGGKEW